jgi:hypothetical protein
MTGLDRVVVLALGLSAASTGLAMYVASPALEYLRANVEQRHVQHLLDRIPENADRFGRSLDLDPASDRGPGDPPGTGEIRQAVSDLGQAAARLRDRSSDRRPDALDVGDLEEVLRCRGSIDDFTQRHQLGADAERLWISLRKDVDRLAFAWTSIDVPASGPAALVPDVPPRRPGSNP